jgi:ATP-binding cassette subfamily C protein
MFDFFSDVYCYSKKQFYKNIFLMILCGVTGGVTFVMLIPLFEVAGITEGNGGSFQFLHALTDLFLTFPESFRLIIILMIYILIIAIQVLFNRQMRISNVELTQGYMKEKRQRLFEATVNADWQLLMERNSSDITNAFTQEINKVSMGSIFFLKVLSQLVIGAVHIIITFLLSWQLSLFVLACGIVMYFFVHPMVKRAKLLGQSVQQNNKRLMKDISEHLGGIKDIKSYGLEESQIAEFQTITEKVEQNMVDFTRLQAKPEIFYKIGAAIIISIYFYFSLNTFKTDLSSTIVILLVFSRLWPLFSSLQGNLQNINIAIPSYKAYRNMLKKLHKKQAGLAGDKLYEEISFKNRIKFDDVSFSYTNSETPVFTNRNLEIKKNEVTMITGESGAGKSTMIDLIMGLLEPTSGVIKIDDQVLDESVKRSWRKKIAYVSQTPFLFSGTLYENLKKFNPEASEGEMWEALEKASAREFVEKLPDKLETVVGDRGVRLSGGERQRIVLARALLRNPEVLILDEATNALDRENREKIEQTVKKLCGDLTIIVVSHGEFYMSEEIKVICL